MSNNRRLRDCQHVSVCDLTGIERFVVWAIRWRASTDAADSFADSCLQSGLLGEAWTTLSRICSTCNAGRALQYLEILADNLQEAGGRIERWQFDGTLAHSSSFKPA